MVQLFPKFQMACNTSVPTLSIFPILGIFCWVLPLCIHALRPGTLEELFSSMHNFFFLSWETFKFLCTYFHVSFVSFNNSRPNINLLTCLFQEIGVLHLFLYIISMESFHTKLGNDCSIQILLSASNLRTYPVYIDLHSKHVF